MNKKKQLKKSLQQLGVDLDQCTGGKPLTSKLLEKIRGSGGISGESHTKHIKQHARGHDKMIFHSKS